MDLVLPIAIIAAFAIVLPIFFVPRATRSHRRVALGILLSALCLILLGPILYALFDTRPIYDRDIQGARRVLLALIFRDSLSAAVVWIPLLGIVWFGRAQRVERLRGEDMVCRETKNGTREE